MKVVIIGGVAGGMSAATRLRRLMEDAEIVVFEKGPFVSFANCGLPYYVSGEIAQREQLLVQTPESLQARFALDVRPLHEVIEIIPESKLVKVRHEDHVLTEAYDVLILSPGATPFVPPIEGLSESKHVYTLRNLTDLDTIVTTIQQQPIAQAVVVGAGFIGLEMAENLAKQGIRVTLVEKADHVLPPLDEEMAAFITIELEKQGVTVITGQAVTAFKQEGTQLLLEDGSIIKTDLTILSVGVQPETTLAKQAGIALGYRGGILVNEQYQTSVPDIYAVGDAIVVKQQITGEDTLISLASPANRQGRQVADIIAGQKRRNQGSIGTAIVRVFELAAAATGLNEAQVKTAGQPYAVVHVTGKDHAGYFPGATDITMKLIFHPETGFIYGAQAVGEKGVDKRIDILATAIKGRLTVADLPELEFSYAPPFGSAKDPVNMLGYAALNIMEGISETIQWYQLEEALNQGSLLLDVRNPDELQLGEFPGALSIPLTQLRDRLTELDETKDYIVSCHSGLRGYIAERILKQAGYAVKNLDGAFALCKAVRPALLQSGRREII